MSKEIITTVRVPRYDYSLIKKLVKEGIYLNFSDFFREAIREKLDKLKVR